MTDIPVDEDLNEYPIDDPRFEDLGEEPADGDDS